MLSLNRVVPRAQRVVSKGVFTGLQSAQPTVVFPVHIFGNSAVSDNDKHWKMDDHTRCIEGFQGDIRDLSLTEARHAIKQAAEYLSEGPSIQGTQDMHLPSQPQTGLTSSSNHHSTHHSDTSCMFEGLNGNISLHGCMQSNVPHPPQHTTSSASGYGSYLNMPGGSGKLLDKYLASSNHDFHPSRHISTSSRRTVSQQGAQDCGIDENELLTDPTPQGIQGDNCVSFRLWMENCQRYNLPNCDEQLEALKNGRKTLAEVFQEQQEIIRLVADSYKAKQKQYISNRERMGESGQQAQQDYFNYSYELSAEEPCPQGLQGEDCATYKAWMKNCKAFGLENCDERFKDFKGGRKTLQDLFDEQNEMIRSIVTDYYQKRTYSTSSKDPKVDSSNDSSSSNSPESMQTPDSNDSKLSNKEKLQRAVKQYGSTVIVFHIGISLISLGGFYVLVSSGFEGPMLELLYKMGVSENFLQSKLAAGSTTFAVAYIIHKCFAPVRIGITLSCTPFIVHYLRRVGFLKAPKP